MPTQTYSSAGTYSFATTAGVIYTVECWGAGGGGSGASGSFHSLGGCGGGGGAYAKTNSFTGTGGNITVVVGTAGTAGPADSSGGDGGNTTFNGTTTVAVGGKKGTISAGGAGGLASASTGDVKHSGGTGGTQVDTNGGGAGGGSSAGTGADGNPGGADVGGTGTGGSGGSAPSGGGAGGPGGDVGVGGNAGSTPGGGGGGGGSTFASSGGAGFDGKVVITWTTPASGTQFTGNITLFISGSPVPTSGNTTLYTRGSVPINSSIPLYTSGNPAPINSNIPLFTNSVGSTNSGITLFLNQQCFNVIRPSGDVGTTPSGNLINSAGNSGTFWNFINDDPLSSVTDTTFINVVESGRVSYAQNLYFNEFGISTSSYRSKGVNLASKNITTIASSGINGYATGLDAVNSFFYITQGGSLVRYRTDFSDSPYTVFSGFANAFYTQRIIFAPRTEYIYALGKVAAATEYSVLRLDKYGNLIDTIYTFTTSDTTASMKYNSRDNYLVVLFYSNVAGTNYYYTRVIYLNSDGSYASDTLNYISTTTYTDISLDIYNNKFYLSTNQIVYEFSGIASPTSIGPLVTVPGTTAITSITSDSRNRNLYVGYMEFNANSGIISSYSMNNGAFNNYVYSNSGQIIYSMCIDKDIYKTTMDFQLTDPNTGMTGNSTNQVISNADVVVRGTENYDKAYVNAKVLNSTRTAMIWKPVGPYSASYSGVEGDKTKYIGVTNSVVNQSYNSLNDWNGAILRVDVTELTDTQPSGNYRLAAAAVELFCSGTFPSPGTSNNSITMFTQAAVPINNSMTLHTWASGSALITTLYIYGKAGNSGNIPLYLWGASPINSGISLYLKSAPLSSSMNLFIKALDVSRTSGNFSLFTYALANSGLFKDMPLFLKTDEKTGKPHSNMNIYTLGGGSYGKSSYMNLFLKSLVPDAINTMTLFVQNNTLATNSGIPLLMFGPQTGGSGWYPSTASMNLFIQRNEGWKNNISLYINGPQPYNNSVPLYLQVGLPSSGIPLYVKGIGVPNNTIPIYVHGF